MKTGKKVLSLVLSVLMLFSLCSVAVANSAEEKLPQIYVNGIGSRAVYQVGDPNKTSLFYPINSELFLENLGRFGEYAQESIENKDPRVVYNCVYSWLWDTFGLCALDTDGVTNLYNVTVDPSDAIDYNSGRYWFSYDSRLDPVDLAHKLKDYVELVKVHSGSDRYELVGSSYGSSILVAYVNEYRDEWDNIDSALICVPSTPGIDFVGEVFSGTFDFNPDVLVDFVKYMVGNEDIDLALSVLNKSGALAAILDFALEPVARVALLDAVNAIVHDVFGTFPSMWSFVQDEYFRPALERVYGADYADPDHSHAELIRKITYYHDNIMVKAPEIFKEATESGIHFNIIAKYGYPAMPFSNSGDVISDSLVDLEDGSYGATCCMRGETLPKDYVQKLYPEYNFLSVDGCVDASTCVLPFNTWIIKDLKHEEKPSEYWEMINRIVHDDLDVFTSEKYPQFMQKSPTDSEKIEPMTVPEAKEETSLKNDAIRLLMRLLTMLFEKLTQLFAA